MPDCVRSYGIIAAFVILLCVFVVFVNGVLGRFCAGAEVEREGERFL
jgi:preprotein translocase subunit SecE